jgi:deoxyadenosine/deoxycytidine kinase
MVSYLKPPDLILYMRAQPDTILQRIKARGRDFEKSIDPDYIRELHQSYEDWADRIEVIAPLHIVDTETLDLKSDRAAQDELVEILRENSRRKDVRLGG